MANMEAEQRPRLLGALPQSGLQSLKPRVGTVWGGGLSSAGVYCMDGPGAAVLCVLLVRARALGEELPTMTMGPGQVVCDPGGSSGKNQLYVGSVLSKGHCLSTVASWNCWFAAISKEREGRKTAEN